VILGGVRPRRALLGGFDMLREAWWGFRGFKNYEGYLSPGSASRPTQAGTACNVTYESVVEVGSGATDRAA